MDLNIVIPSTSLAGAVCYGIFMYFKHWRPAKQATNGCSIHKESQKVLRDILMTLNVQNEAKKYDTEQIKNLKSMVAQCQKDIADLRLEVAKHGS